MVLRARHSVVLSFSNSVPTLPEGPHEYTRSQFLTADLRTVRPTPPDWPNGSIWPTGMLSPCDRPSLSATRQ
jgi:hypothetical protein